MPTIKASSIITRAATLLHDETGERWPESELLKWLNDGQRQIVLLKWDAYTECESVQLDPGTKQSIPSQGLSLIDVIRNMGSDGSTPGKPVMVLPKRVLDYQHQSWHYTDEQDEIEYFCFDDRSPRRFFVFPPSDGTTYVELVYSSSPTDVAVDDIEDTWTAETEISFGDQIIVTADDSDDYVFECVAAGTTGATEPGSWPSTFREGVIDGTVVWQNVGSGTIQINDIYANALLDYIIYRAYLKDADFNPYAQRASLAYETFTTSLGLLDQKELRDDPRVRAAVE